MRRVHARAPVRVDPAGGGTDAPPFCVEYGGAVVNFGIQLYAYARVELDKHAMEVSLRSADLGEEVCAPSVNHLQIDGHLDLLKGIARRLAPPFGFTLSVESEVPPGSGLGLSGAAGVACVGALQAAMGRPLPPHEVAALANEIERGDLGYAGGSQDSYGAALGGINLLIYRKGGGVDPQRLKVAPHVVRELERRCLLVYTGEAHLSGTIHEDIKRSYGLTDSPTVDAMKNLMRIGLDSAGALEAGNVEAFGRLLNDNWHHHQRLHPSCNSAGLERFYDAARDDVVGGKTCGAGGGGFILFLAREGRRSALETKCRAMGGWTLPLRIDAGGLVVW